MFGQSVVLSRNKPIKIKDMIPGKVTMESESIWRDGGSHNSQKNKRTNLPQGKKGLEQQGGNDAVKDIERDKEINQNMLDNALDRSQTVLYHCKTVFPFDFFPNDLIIDLAKVTVVFRNFFMSGSLQSIYMTDIVDIEIDTGPFFSSLAVVDKFYAQNKLEIHYLSKKNAIKAREIILGVVAAIKLNVNLTSLDGDNVLDQIRELAIASRAPSP